MTPNPCDICPSEGKYGCNNCKRWQIWFRERWAYIHGYAIAHGIQPTTPPEEVNEFDEGSAGSDS